MLKFILFGFLAAVIVLNVYIRLAPSRAADWHETKLPPLGAGQFPAVSGYVEQRDIEGDGAAQMAQLDQIIRATPQTMALVGTLESGKMTYVTRSKVIGFPDYTTVSLIKDAQTGATALQVFGRLRFGRSDLGVNRQRIEGWLAQLDAGTGTDTPTQ